MAKPEVIATQFGPAEAEVPWANTGAAKHKTAIAIKTKLRVLRIVFAPYELPQLVVDVILVQTPSH
jgi:hypothetical protein